MITVTDFHCNFGYVEERWVYACRVGVERLFTLGEGTIEKNELLVNLWIFWEPIMISVRDFY